MKYLNKIYFLFAFLTILVFYQAFNSFSYMELSSALNSLLKVFQNIVCLFLISNILFNFNLKNILIITPFAYYEQKISFFAIYVHELFLKLYPFFFKNPESISPEYPRIIFIFIIFIISFLFLLKKKNFFNTLFFIGSLGALTTTLIFHAIIVFQVTKFKENDKHVMENITVASKTKNDFAISCFSNNYTCYYFDNYQNIYSDTEIPIELKPILNIIKTDLSSSKLYLFYSTIHKTTSMDRVFAQTPFSIIRKDDAGLIILNNNTYKNFLIQNQFVFFILASISNFVWIFGSIFLIYFHRNKFKKRKV